MQSYLTSADKLTVLDQDDAADTNEEENAGATLVSYANAAPVDGDGQPDASADASRDMAAGLVVDTL
jgi:hypothetical protein